MTIRNTVIGSLMKDLSKGKSLEKSVKSYEQKVAGDNYKRPKALITSGMIKNALQEINKRGLEPALYRRHAKLSDMNVNDILFVDKTIQKDMKGGILSELVPQKRTKTKTKSIPKDIEIDVFISDVLQKTSELKVKLENRHIPNMLNIFTAVNQDAPKLFKWNNQFSCGYTGSVADSRIKQNVSKAGGDIKGDIRISLGWYDSDDLDLSLLVPKHDMVCYTNKQSAMFELDVDMNIDSYTEPFDPDDPEESITRATLADMPIGEYIITVHNYKQRTNSGKGFALELEILGVIYKFTYTRQLSHNERITCLSLFYDGTDMKITNIHSDLSSDDQSQKIWGLNTNEFCRVSLVTLSPNYWSESIGNKHYIFILDACLNPNRARAIYNEFLLSELTHIRKTFEVLGSKALVEYSETQLSGLGFSSTKRNNMVVLCDGQPYSILF